MPAIAPCNELAATHQSSVNAHKWDNSTALTNTSAELSTTLLTTAPQNNQAGFIPSVPSSEALNNLHARNGGGGGGKGSSKGGSSVVDAGGSNSTSGATTSADEQHISWYAAGVAALAIAGIVGR